MEDQPTSRRSTPTENYESIAWSPLNVHLLKSLYEGAALSMQCNQSDGRRYPGHWEGVPMTHVQVPLQKSERPCPAETRQKSSS
ncbi:hypothetical protein V1264_006259 [Littorina saxatilis]|uniref:Uncharacterized protein n=2 Tax=Littorina saxatilis TaxID=31220 RepID=A0AAN9AXA2_9CAEN